MGGILKNVTMEEALVTLMGYGLNGEQGTEALKRPEYRGLRGVDVVPPSNTKRYKQIVIPVGTRIVDLPNYLQSRYGVYSTGIGRFLQNGRWYIFPIKDFNLFTKRSRTLTIANLPEAEVPAIDKTYMMRGDKLYVAATGQVIINDESEEMFHRVANGLRYFPSSNLLDDMSTPKDNTLTTRLSETLKEFTISERRDGLNQAYFVSGLYTDNPFRMVSEASGILGRFFDVTWFKSDHSLLYPGMPVKLLFVKGGVLRELSGVLVGSQVSVSQVEAGIGSRQYMGTTTLRIFAKLVED